MTTFALIGAGIFDGDQLRDGQALWIKEGVVHAICPPDALPKTLPVIVLKGGILAPGFVDLQVNGGGGVMFNDAPNLATLRQMAQAHARLGATCILPTLITDREDVTRAAIDAVAQAVAVHVPGIAGLHLEGPHLAPSRKGAHDAALIRPMEDSDLALLLKAAKTLPLLKVTLASEAVTPDKITRLTQAGVLVSLGHSDCTREQAAQATAAGARCVTHLFNAMSQLTSRAPGLVGAALSEGGLSAGVIADLVHVHPDTIRLALAANQGPGQVFLVSDAMAVAGSEAKQFTLNGRLIRRHDGRLTLQDGTLAGADLDLATALRNLVQAVGVPLAQALAMATSIPGDLAGRGGRLKAGGQPDMVWLDDGMRLRQVWQAGVALL